MFGMIIEPNFQRTVIYISFANLNELLYHEIYKIFFLESFNSTTHAK